MATSGNGSTRPWLLRETALLFNYADECLRDQKNYKTTVVAKVLRATGRITTSNGVEGRLYRVLKDFAGEPSMKDLLQKGSSCLDLSQLTDEQRELVVEMNRQRSDLNLQELDEGTSKPFGNDTASVSDSEMSNHKKARMSRSRSSKGKYRETTISDSESPKDDMNDADYIEEDLVVETNSPMESLKMTKPDSSSHELAARKPVAPTPTQKGKEPARVVIDLDEKLPPSPNTIDPEETSRIPKTPKVSIAFQEHLLSKSKVASGPTQKRKAPTKEGASGDDISSPPSKRLAKNDMPSSSQTKSSIADGLVDYGNGVRGTPFLLPKGLPSTDSLVRLPPIETQVATLHRELDDIRYVLFSIMQEQVETRKPLTEEMKRRLDKIKQDMRQQPGTLVQGMLDSLVQVDRARHDLRQKFHSVLGYPDAARPYTFPLEVVDKVDWDWSHIRAGIRAIFMSEDSATVKGPLPSSLSAGYVTSTIDDLLVDRKGRRDLFDKLQGYLESPKAAQSLISALLCRWLFAVPNPQCDGFHTDFTMKQYEIKALSDGLEEVQELDKIGFSRVFADKSFQEDDLPRLGEKLVTRLFSAIKQACPAAGHGGCFNRKMWAETALKLKQKLSISPHDYRIHFCTPGILFDPTWMKAEDEKGLLLKEHEAEGKEIIMCLFPAPVQQKPKPFEKDTPLADALVKNKNFFPTWQEKHSFDSKHVISKATVLVKYG